MKRFHFLLCVLLLGFSVPAAAQAIRFQTDANAPVDIAADKLLWQQKSNRADLSGAAHVTQGALTLSADFMQIIMGADGTAQKLKARGNVIVDDGIQTARAGQADYDLQNNELQMRDDVSVTQKANKRKVSGAALRINMSDGQATLSGSQKSRARIQLGN